MGALFYCSTTTGFLSFLEAANSTGCCEQTYVRLVLDLPEKQHSHHEVSQQNLWKKKQWYIMLLYSKLVYAINYNKYIYII